MSKRANGEGSIYQRNDGRWCAACFVLRADGGRVRKQVYGKTRAEVASKLRDLIRSTEQGIPLAGNEHTVNSYADHWLMTLDGSLKPSTVSNYRWVLSKYIRPELGNVQLRALTQARVRRLMTAVDQQGVSTRTVQLTHAVLRTMLAEAVREEVISRNVAALVKAPRPNVAERTPWNEHQARQFLSIASKHRHGLLFELALTLGLRRGELLGLRWEDVDLADRKLHVRQQMQRLGADVGIVFGAPKSARSRRTIPLSESLVAALLRRRQSQAAELSANEATNVHGLVFTTGIGTPIEPSNLRREFNEVIEQAKVPRIRFHDLRHTCATLLASRNVPLLVIKELLGHSTLSMTADLYAHVLPSSLVEATNTLDRLFSSDGDHDR